VLSGRGLCDELITRPEESYRLWCVVVVCDLEISRIGAPYIYDISSLRVKLLYYILLLSPIWAHLFIYKPSTELTHKLKSSYEIFCEAYLK